jgi:hypothetical protein
MRAVAVLGGVVLLVFCVATRTEAAGHTASAFMGFLPDGVTLGSLSFLALVTVICSRLRS